MDPPSPTGGGRVKIAVENYVKVIYAHTEWQSESITSTAIAARLGLAASSVTEMVKKLVAQGLVVHEPYGAVELTPEGRALALQMVRRHRLIETWLVQRMDFAWDEVHDEAEILEHAMSDRLLNALDDQLGNPVRDPHGDPIPDRHGVLHLPPAVLLADAPDGGTIVRISDRDPLLLRHLEAEGIVLDAAVSPARRAELAPEALESIWVAAP